MATMLYLEYKISTSGLCSSVVVLDGFKFSGSAGHL